MAFNPELSADLLALKTRVMTDPDSVGYGAVLNDTAALLDLLNNPTKNTTGGTVDTPVEALDILDLAAVIVPSEYALLSDFDKEWVKMFINRPVDERLKPYQAKIQSVFAGTATLTAMLALRTRPSSQAEDEFGVGTVITRKHLVAARHTA